MKTETPIVWPGPVRAAVSIAQTRIQPAPSPNIDALLDVFTRVEITRQTVQARAPTSSVKKPRNSLDVPVGIDGTSQLGKALIGPGPLEFVHRWADGGIELDMVVNVGKVLTGDWDFVREELRAVIECTHAGGGLVKVIFENERLRMALKGRNPDGTLLPPTTTYWPK